MATKISIFNNEPTIVHITSFPKNGAGYFDFGFTPGKKSSNPALTIRVKYQLKINDNPTIDIATYKSSYQIEPEKEVISENLYECCVQAVHAMKMFLKYDPVGCTIHQESMVCPPQLAFGADLSDLAKALNTLPNFS